jgi:cephalosporin hydroxylase
VIVTFDDRRGMVSVRETEDSPARELPLADPEAFQVMARAWLRAGWDTKYVYTFTWMGRPIIQLPDDLLRLQEVIYAVKPTVVIETGVAHGGSLIFHASLLKAMEIKGRVLGVDIEIRPHNRTAIEQHPLSSMITLIEGDSIGESTLARVREHVQPDDVVLVVLDSKHTRDHVRSELEMYGPLVTKGSYIVATDGIMRDLVGAPRSSAEWGTDNPFEAARAFAAKHPEFEHRQPTWSFNESTGLSENVTYWPGAWLRRRH